MRIVCCVRRRGGFILGYVTGLTPVADAGDSTTGERSSVRVCRGCSRSGLIESKVSKEVKEPVDVLLS